MIFHCVKQGEWIRTLLGQLQCSGELQFLQNISLLCDNGVTTQNVRFFSGEIFKGFEVLLFSMSATTTQLVSSGQLCKLRYDSIPVQRASANVSFHFYLMSAIPKCLTHIQIYVIPIFTECDKDYTVNIHERQLA